MSFVRLGDFLEVQSGFAFKTEHFTSGDGMPLIRIRDLARSKTEINYSGTYRPDFVVNSGDYLIGMDGNFRCHRWQGGESLLNQRVCRIRHFQEDIEPDYVYYGIQRKLQDIEDTTSFMTVKHLSAKQVQNIKMPLPSLPEQRRIVDLLSRAEGIVRLRREAEKKAAELIPALFNDMFGDPATNPKGWPIEKLDGLLSSIDSGHSPVCHARKRLNQEWCVLKLSALTGSAYRESEHKVLPKEVAPDQTVEVRRGDLLISRKNTADLVGTAAYVWHTQGKALLPDLIFRLNVADSNRLNSLYLWGLLTLPVKRVQIKALASGSAGSMPNISKSRLKTLDIEVPPLDRQIAYAQALEQIVSIQSQQTSATAKAQATFDALLARCFVPTAAVEGRSSD